jgi:hypothetical protein
MWPSLTDGRRAGSARRASSTAARSPAPQLGVARGDLLLEAVQQCVEIRGLHGGADVGFRAAHGRLAAEVEFAPVDVGHLREALAQRVEADDVGIHLADAHGHRVDAALQLGLQFLDLGLLLGQGRGPGGDAARRAALALADLEAEAEDGGEDGDEDGGEAGDCQGMGPG